MSCVERSVIFNTKELTKPDSILLNRGIVAVGENNRIVTPADISIVVFQCFGFITA